jgi:hypothetical protein
VYAKHTGGTDTIEETDNKGINAIDNEHRLPGENPSETDGNLEIYVHVPKTLDNNRTLSLKFIDSSNGLLSAMYPDPADMTATHVSGNVYKFSVTTKKDEQYGKESLNGTYYSGDNEYKFEAIYNDNNHHWEETETCKFYMHPVFKLLFNDGENHVNYFSFDNDGNATIYFSVHIAGAPTEGYPHGTTRIPDPTKYQTSDPDLHLPLAGETYNQSEWNDTGCLLQISDASGLSFRCDGIARPVSGGSYFYKLEVSDDVGFNGTANLQLNVFNKTKTATLRNIVTFQNIKWWNGSSEIMTQDMNAAYLSPVTRFDTSGVPTTVLSMTAVVAQEPGHEFDLDKNV